MNGGNWRGIGGNVNEGINKAARSSIINGGPSGIEMDLAGIIVEMEQKLERTINSRLDVLQSQMAQFDRKLYFIEMKLDTLNGLFGTEMPTNEFGRAAGRANRARGKGGNRFGNNQQMQIFGGGRHGGGGGGEGASAFEEDLMGDEGLMSEDFLPPALRFLFNQFSPQSEEMGSSNAIRSTSQRTMTAFYGNGNVGRNGGGQQRRFAAATASSANFSAQMAASIGFTNGPAALNGNAENGVGKQHLHRGNGMERKMSNGGGGGNRNQQQLDGGFGQGRRGNNAARNNANGQQWWTMAETNAKKGNNAGANRAATKQKQTLGTGANRIPIWTTRSVMGSYTVSEESEEEEEEEKDGKKEGEKVENGKGEEGTKEGNGEEKQQMNGVDKEWGRQIGGEMGKSGRRKSF